MHETHYDHVPPRLARARHPIVYDHGLWERASRFAADPMTDSAVHSSAGAAPEAALLAGLGRRAIVLVGMMGAGKSSIGRRVAARLGIPFIDADAEIELAAGMSIGEIFEQYGEAYFRAGETRVIARLLEAGPHVLATGGGAFMNPDTRAAIRARSISVWLRAEFDVLMRRVKRRGDRPMLKTANPAETLKCLMTERYPVYAEADVTVESREVPHDTIVEEILQALRASLAVAGADRQAPRSEGPKA
jgi:shikimate kinase